MFNVIILAILQGVAEFLPISSSGHLVIGRTFLGLEEAGVRLDLMLHVGTLVSICLFYRQTIIRIIRNFEWSYMLKIIVSAIPAVIVYALFKNPIKGLFANVQMVGALLMFTGAVLVGTRYLPNGSKGISFFRAALMGCGQALALLPGISRSGMTLVSARAGKVSPELAAEFSFLMSAPLILGGMLLDLLEGDGGASAACGVGWLELIIGAVISAVVGYLALVLLVRALKGRWFWLFGPYCLAAGLGTLVWSLAR